MAIVHNVGGRCHYWLKMVVDTKSGLLPTRVPYSHELSIQFVT